MTTIRIFGAGPAGLYMALRLFQSDALDSDDTVALYDWGDYRFTEVGGSREAAGRICTYHYQDNSRQSYVEVGGMRYLQWDFSADGSGHRLVSTMIEQLGLSQESVEFNTTSDPLFFVRGRNFYSSDIDRNSPAPFNTGAGLSDMPPESAYSYAAARAIAPGTSLRTRTEQCRFYREGRLPQFYNGIFESGERLRDIGYWNLLYDTLGNEGYRYADIGGGYESNVINWNSADALLYNSEFAPGGVFKTLSRGYSSLFRRMFHEIEKLAEADDGPSFEYHPNERLHSITAPSGSIAFRTATAAAPTVGGSVQTADKVVLAMPPEALELVAQATRYADIDGDVLNAAKVRLYRESVIKQPSYKVAMFFSEPWWEDSRYSPRLLGADGDTANVFGPTITDTPLRQVYYFGNNAFHKDEVAPVFGVLASYDDESFVGFWQELELGPDVDREVARSEDLQPLVSPRPAPDAMVRMLRAELARVHNGPEAELAAVPVPLETVFMDWALKPFGAGYHAWSAHYDICDVMQRIRQPSSLVDDLDADVFIVGSAYSNDQAWVEGAFCTSESVLNDYFGLEPIIDRNDYPFICE